MEPLTTYLPQAAYGLGMLLAGFGGSKWHSHRNDNGKEKDNGKDNGKYVTHSEFLGEMKTIRKESRADREIIFNKLDNLSGEISNLGNEVARIQGAHER